MNMRNIIKNHPAHDFDLLPSDEEHLRKLSGQDRELLEFATRDKLAYGVISDLTGLNLGTVKSKINRARTKILQMRNAAKTKAMKQAEETHV